MRNLWQSVVVGLLLAVTAMAQNSGTVELTGPLGEWRDEVEASGERRLIVARVYVDRRNGNVYLPDDIPERPRLLPYFNNTGFLKELLAAHSLSISENLEEDGGSIHFILLNMGRYPEWMIFEDAVIAHELGHVWLFANDYSSPVYEGKGDSCLAIMTGEMLQHGMIREEMTRRGIDPIPYWTNTLEQSLAHLERTSPTPAEELETCRLMSQMSLWVDLRLGLSPVIWPNYERLITQLRRHYPILEQNSDVLYRELQGANLRDKEVYQLRLENTLHQMYGFVKLVLKRDENRPQVSVEQIVVPSTDGQQ